MDRFTRSVRFALPPHDPLARTQVRALAARFPLAAHSRLCFSSHGVESRAAPSRRTAGKNQITIMKRFLTITAALAIIGTATFLLPRATAQTNASDRQGYAQALESYSNQVSRADQILRQKAEQGKRADQMFKDQEDRARRVETLVVRQEQLMDKQEAAFTRFQKILDTWDRQQKQYQQYLDSLKK
jgi:hypothetical protein